MSHSDVFVIGAGPAGLTAAYLLTKQGISTTVIEADPRYVGGISRTVNYKDFLFDIGGHRFFSKSKEVVDLWHELLPDDSSQREEPQPGYPGRERVLTYFREGNVFGVLALLGREPQVGYTVQAASRSEVIRVPGAALSSLLS